MCSSDLLRKVAASPVVTVVPVTTDVTVEPVTTAVARPMASDFDRFWSAYPKKTGKDDALAVWRSGKTKIGRQIPPVEILLESLVRAKTSRAWTKDDGQYIPNPATWLRQARWEDEFTTDMPSAIMNGHNQQVLQEFVDRRGQRV